MFTSVALVFAEVEFVLETRGLEHVREVVRALAPGGVRGHPAGPERPRRSTAFGLTRPRTSVGARARIA
jgi:hypothetical protein